MTFEDPHSDREPQTVRVAKMVGPQPPPRPPLPVATLAFVAANILMAVAQWIASGSGDVLTGSLGNSPADWALGAKVPSLVAHGEYWRLVTANFLHGSLVHLLFNMISLVVLGRLVEIFYGRLRFSVIFVLSCVSGAVLSYQLTQGVSLGASTGVMGLMGAILLHNARYRKHLPARLNAVYPLFLAILIVQLTIDYFNQGVDLWGHIGGLIGGVAMAALLAGRVEGPGQPERDWLPLPTAVATAVLLLGYGAFGLVSNLPSQTGLLRAAASRSPEALTDELATMTRKRPYFVEARLVLAGVLLRSDHLEDAQREFENVLRKDPRLRSTLAVKSLNRQFAGVYFQRAMRAYNRRSWEAVVGFSEAGLAFDGGPELEAQVLNQYAWTLVEHLDRDYKKAEELAGRAVQINPKEAAFIDTLAWSLYKQGRYQDALNRQLSAMTSVVGNLSPDNAEYYYHLGAIYEKLDRKAEAAKAYREALVGRISYPEARAGLERVAPGTLPGPKPSTPPPPQFRRSDPASDGLI